MYFLYSEPSMTFSCWFLKNQLGKYSLFIYPQFRSIILCDLLLYIEVTFWDLSIDLGIFWGSWFLHRHEIPPPKPNGGYDIHKEILFIQGILQSSMFYLYIGLERSAFPFSPILLVH